MRHVSHSVVDLEPEAENWAGRFAMITSGGALLVLIFASSLAFLNGIEVGYLLRDPAQLYHYPPYAGLLSNVGVLVWAGCAFIAAFAATVLRTAPGATRTSRWLLAVAIWSTVLCFDDFFILHEISAISGKVLFPAYGVCLAIIVAFGVYEIRRYNVLYLLLTGFFFFMSLTVDFFQESVESMIGEFRILLEDGAKFMGVVFWLNFVWVTALHAIDKSKSISDG